MTNGTDKCRAELLSIHKLGLLLHPPTSGVYHEGLSMRLPPIISLHEGENTTKHLWEPSRLLSLNKNSLTMGAELSVQSSKPRGA